MKQAELVLERPAGVQQAPTVMEMMQQALASGMPGAEMAHVIKELAGVLQSQERFAWEREERQAKIDFDDAKNRCQKAIGRITPNQKRSDTNSWWADYAQLDRTLRPIYTAEGFSISFSEVPSIAPGKVRIQGELSRGGISKSYHSEITPTTTGPKGGAMATATDADAIAQSRAKRYIMLDIFNIAVGIDAEEKKGIPEPEHPMNPQDLQDALDAIKQAPNPAAYEEMFLKAHKDAKDDLQAHLDIDLFAIKEAPTPEALRGVWKMIHAKRTKDGNTEILRRVVAANEEAKTAFAKGGML